MVPNGLNFENFDHSIKLIVLHNEALEKLPENFYLVLSTLEQVYYMIVYFQ